MGVKKRTDERTNEQGVSRSRMMYPKSVEINSCRKDLIEAQISRSIHVETGTYHSESSSSLKDTALVGKLRTEWEAFNLDHRNFNFREETESGKEEFCWNQLQKIAIFWFLPASTSRLLVLIYSRWAGKQEHPRPLSLDFPSNLWRAAFWRPALMKVEK